ncbi:MAG: hypothetical protein LCH54_14990 [Bacteroidetes bacterium]|nr:hypothetical protein [Bacteroidota bacterium]
MKKFLINAAVLLILISGCSTVTGVFNPPEVTVLKALSDSIRVAVPDFQVSGPGITKKPGASFAGLLTETWVFETGLKVTDRNLVVAAQSKLKLEPSSQLNLKQMNELGSVCQSEVLILGSVETQQDGVLFDPEAEIRVSVSLRWIDVNSGDLLALGNSERRITGNPDATVREMIRQIVKKGNWIEKKKEPVMVADTTGEK